MEVLGKTKVDEVKVALVIIGLPSLLLIGFGVAWMNADESGDPLWHWLLIWLVTNLAIGALVVWKCYNVFRVVSWNRDKIWSSHIITGQEMSIPWDEASILYEKNNEYTVIGSDNKKLIRLEYSRWRTAEKKAAQFVHKKWEESFKNYTDQMREKELCLWEDEGYESSIKRDKLWINGKSLPLSKILSVWKESMAENHDTTHQRFVLRIQGDEYLLVRVGHVYSESFLRYIKECSSSVKIFSSYMYREKLKDADGELMKEEERFCKIMLKTEKVSPGIYVLMGILCMSYPLWISPLLTGYLGSSEGSLYTVCNILLLGCTGGIVARVMRSFQKRRQRCYVDTL